MPKTMMQKGYYVLYTVCNGCPYIPLTLKLSFRSLKGVQGETFQSVPLQSL